MIMKHFFLILFICCMSVVAYLADYLLPADRTLCAIFACLLLWAVLAAFAEDAGERAEKRAKRMIERDYIPHRDYISHKDFEGLGERVELLASKTDRYFAKVDKSKLSVSTYRKFRKKIDPNYGKRKSK